MKRLLALGFALAALAAGPAPAWAQAGVSLLGLGRPDAPVDARIRALGGAGVVAHGRNYSLLNPATLAGIASPGVLLSFGTETRDVEGTIANGNVRGTRFPVGQIVYPLGERWVAGLGFGAFLDQDWLASFEDTLRLTADTVPFTENRSSEGGVTQVRGAVAFRLAGPVHVGVGLDLYSGDVTRAVRRRFDDPSANLSPYSDEARWEYDAWGWSAGMTLRPRDDIQLGAAVTWADDLEAVRDTIGTTETFPLPLRVYAGTSWRLVPGVIWVAQFGHASWSRTAPALSGNADDTWSIGTGIESTLLRRETTQYALRVGYRRATLPFTTGGDQGTEYAWSVGAGGVLADGLVTVDLTLDFGKRGGLPEVGIEESFRRFSFGLSVSQR